MKKLLLLLAGVIAMNNCFASHLMGGQMTARNIGGLTYEITLTEYRDTVGIPMYDSTYFNFLEVGGTWTALHKVGHTGAIVFGNGVEEYTYIDTITFPNGGNFNIYSEDCCRNCAIINLSNPCGESFHLGTNVWVDPTNSTPVFLNPPITLAQLQVPFNYNPMPFDADGDSIVWSVDTPLTAIATYVQGWVVPSADALSPFTMDPLTGEVSFLPNLQGYFVASFLVSEYRNGVKIGEIRRDMQIIVVPSFNNPPVISSNSNNFPFSGKSYTIAPGSSFNLTVSIYDADAQPVAVNSVGEPLILASNPATVGITTNGNTTTASVNWTPNASQVRVLPYILALRVADTYGSNVFYNDISFALRVGNATFINSTESDVVKGIYPNPSYGNFSVEMSSEKSQNVVLSITNLIGQQLKSIPQQLNSGINLVNITNLDLPNGKYLLSVVSNGKIMETKTFEIR